MKALIVTITLVAMQMLTGCANTQPAQNLSATMQQRIMGLEQENALLRGMIEESQHQIKQTQDQQKQLYIELDDRLTAVEKKRR
jgi:TolA-binding protein